MGRSRTDQMAKTYYEKLLDPRWQKKRLEILSRDNFTCERCGATDQTLHVHHGYYERGLDPWEYDPKTLHCLCDGCHEIAQERLRDIHMEIAKLRDCDMDDLMAEVLAIRGVREMQGVTV